MVIEVILYILAFATAAPVGLLLAWLCDDELIYPRKYFKLMIYALLLSIMGFLIFYRNIAILLSMSYMIFVFWVMLWKGKN